MVEKGGSVVAYTRFHAITSSNALSNALFDSESEFVLSLEPRWLSLMGQ